MINKLSCELYLEELSSEPNTSIIYPLYKTQIETKEQTDYLVEEIKYIFDEYNFNLSELDNIQTYILSSFLNNVVCDMKIRLDLFSDIYFVISFF